MTKSTLPAYDDAAHPHDGPAMLMGHDRIFYAGRLRRSLAPRYLGAISIYASQDGDFDISIGTAAVRRLRAAAVPANMPHQLRPPAGPIWNLLIEPESITEAAADLLEDFIADANGSAHSGRSAVLLPRFAQAERTIRRTAPLDAPTTANFDRLFFGASLPGRNIDPRTAEILRLIAGEPNDLKPAAEDFADHVGLSVSRMLRLFRDDTGVPFRKLRMWKRARRFLDQANGNSRLTDVAIDLGYPDSSHFSNSIRRIFGMRPAMMRAGARDMRIWPCAGYMLSGT